MKRPAVFFDRDGTLIEFYEVLTDPAKVNLLPGAEELIAALKRDGYLALLVTNQPSLEKGLMTKEELSLVHAALQEKLHAGGGALDALYTCPHTYKAEGQCVCRKPGVGLIEQAEAEFKIDRGASYMVGDRLRDIETGRRAGMKTILIASASQNTDDEFFPNTKPDYTASSLLEVLTYIKK